MPIPRVGLVDLPHVAATASREAGGLDPTLLGSFPAVLVDAVTTGRRLRREEVDDCRACGSRAAEDGVALNGLVDLYLSAARLVWRAVPPPALPAGVQGMRAYGEAVLLAADEALAAVAAGFQDARRQVVRREEAARREFFDDVLAGSVDAVDFTARAQLLGFDLAGSHTAIVAEGAAPGDLARVVRTVEDDLVALGASQWSLAAVKDARLVVIQRGDGARTSEFVRDRLQRTFGPGWTVAVGRPRTGALGVAASYEEAKQVLWLAARLGIASPLVRAVDLLVYQVLLRDKPAMSDLVAHVLGPLDAARGGAQPLIDTLACYFQTGGVTTETARRLHLSVRAVSYRLARIEELTGHSPDDPVQRLALEVAVAGARLLADDAPQPKTK